MFALIFCILSIPFVPAFLHMLGSALAFVSNICLLIQGRKVAAKQSALLLRYNQIYERTEEPAGPADAKTEEDKKEIKVWTPPC